jgi:hypothetical protein
VINAHLGNSSNRGVETTRMTNRSTEVAAEKCALTEERKKIIRIIVGKSDFPRNKHIKKYILGDK